MSRLLGLMPTIICVLFACAHTQKLGDTAAHNEWLTVNDHNKSRVQDSPVSTYTIKCHVHIKYNYYRSPTSPSPDFVLRSPRAWPRQSATLRYHSSLLSHLYCVIQVFSLYPRNLPHPIIRGPVPHRMLSPHEIQSLGNPVHYMFLLIRINVLVTSFRISDR